MGPIVSLNKFVSTILGRRFDPARLTTFRGHGSEAYQLSPSIFRKPVTRKSEHLLLRELVAAHPEDFTTDASALEMLVRMQHY